MAEWPSLQRKRGRELKAEMALVGVTVKQVAGAMGILPSTLSAYLGGLQKAPKNFDERVLAAITKAAEAVEAAEVAS